MQTCLYVCVYVCANLVLCVRFECIWAHGLQENSLNTGKNEKWNAIFKL